MSYSYIPINKVTTVVADKESANFPAEYVISNHPKQVWKSTDHTGELTVSVDALSNCLFISNTNATQIDIEVDDGTVIIPLSSRDMTGIDTLEEFMVGDSTEEKKTLWFDYCVLVPSTSTITISFIKGAGDPVECGMVWVGMKEVSLTVLKGINDSFEDYSLVEEQAYNNGATYILQRDTARTISCVLRGEQTEVDVQFAKFRRDIGAVAVPVKVVDNVEGTWDFFARFSTPPKKTYDAYGLATIAVDLVEQL